jgi:hypothetical protein
MIRKRNRDHRDIPIPFIIPFMGCRDVSILLYQASFILPHCPWLSLLPTTPNTHFVAQKEGQSRELGITCSEL